METPITRAEHEEFRKRIEGRLEQLEEYVKEITRLQMLENRDGEMWRSIVNYVITTIIGIAIGYIFTRWGIN